MKLFKVNGTGWLAERKQLSKMHEELQEVCNAYSLESKQRTLEECLDLIQATVSLMHLVASEGEIMAEWDAHNKKMESRGYEIEGSIKWIMENNTHS